MTESEPKLVAVIGDVHHHIALAAEGLERLEAEIGRAIDQVFSVGDLGLFLDESDWEFLTGPKKYRFPEESPKIREAWQAWRWPISMIAGNHDLFHRLRDWQPEYFDHKLEYTDAGGLPHGVEGLRVVGLSGIFHPDDLRFPSGAECRKLKLAEINCWRDMVPPALSGKFSRSQLAYYKEQEIELLKRLDLRPDLLLLHDWPIAPPHIRNGHARRPEAEIVAACEPSIVCCGHHHAVAEFQFSKSQVFALNIVSTSEKACRHIINPGWAALFSYENGSLSFLQTWPKP